MPRAHLVLASCVMCLALPLSAEPRLVIGPNSALVQGVTAGGRVALLSVSVGDDAVLPRTGRIDALLVADAEGQVVLDLERDVAPRSVWVAVDATSGEFLLAAPDGHEVREIRLPSSAVGATRRTLSDSRRFLEVLVVRPLAAVPAGQNPSAVAGSWRGSFGDGGSADRGHAGDGRIEAALEELEPLGDSPPPPEELSQGDILIGVDRTTLEVYAVRLSFPGSAQ